ncbi:hypothetical protein VNI00_012202 [Paramarasmius palmivorus]|uniref:Uncharacterized protein n=1 Tax=Paramarasmius palmivorus TaxID=297713 RepID=A0AAW0C7C7_9AGAR
MMERTPSKRPGTDMFNDIPSSKKVKINVEGTAGRAESTLSSRPWKKAPVILKEVADREYKIPKKNGTGPAARLSLSQHLTSFMAIADKTESEITSLKETLRTKESEIAAVKENVRLSASLVVKEKAMQESERQLESTKKKLDDINRNNTSLRSENARLMHELRDMEISKDKVIEKSKNKVEEAGKTQVQLVETFIRKQEADLGLMRQHLKDGVPPINTGEKLSITKEQFRTRYNKISCITRGGITYRVGDSVSIMLANSDGNGQTVKVQAIGKNRALMEPSQVYIEACGVYTGPQVVKLLQEENPAPNDSM